MLHGNTANVTLEQRWRTGRSVDEVNFRITATKGAKQENTTDSSTKTELKTG